MRDRDPLILKHISFISSFLKTSIKIHLLENNESYVLKFYGVTPLVIYGSITPPSTTNLFNI